jgi:hypothetical protein
MTTRPVGWSGSDRTRCRAVPMTSSGVVGRPRMSAAESDTAFGAICDANAPLLSFAVAVGAPRTAGRPAWVPLLAPRVGRDALVTDSTSPCHVLCDGVDLHQRQPSIAVHERLGA